MEVIKMANAVECMSLSGKEENPKYEGFVCNMDKVKGNAFGAYSKLYDNKFRFTITDNNGVLVAYDTRVNRTFEIT